MAAEVMCSFRDKAEFPVTVIKERTPGKCNAINSGLATARGGIIAFTDDDCYEAPDYIGTEVFSTRPIDYCGGRILLFDEFDSLYACDLDPRFCLIPPRTFLDPGDIQGANMIFRRAVIDRLGWFDARIRAGTPFRCEAWAGFTGAHVPELVVFHHHGVNLAKRSRICSARTNIQTGPTTRSVFFLEL
jgi:hypothetical protein